MAWRYGKVELAMESPWLWSWQNRPNLLLVVALAYSFLLSPLDRFSTMSANGCSATGVTEQESGAKMP